MNFDYEENAGKNALFTNPSHQYCVPQCEENDCHANNKMNGNYYEYPSFSYCTDELDHKENSGKKAFLANPMQQYHLTQCGEHDCHANNKKNGDCYEYPSLSHFTDEL